MWRQAEAGPCVGDVNLVQILIGTTWMLLPGAYAAPSVARVTPDSLSVDGGLVTIVGANFGPGPCANPGRLSAVALRVTPTDSISSATFHPATRTWSSVPGPQDAECVVVQWTPSAIVCRAPPGADRAVPLRITAAGQSTVVEGALGYDPPVVSAVTSAAGVGTAGGTAVAVTGSGFPLPPWPVVVLAGESPCAVVGGVRTTTAVMCVVPRGVGTVQVVVLTPVQSSNVTAPLTYAPPEIASVVTSAGRPIAGGFVVEVVGQVRRGGDLARCFCTVVLCLYKVHSEGRSRVQLLACGCVVPAELLPQRDHGHHRG